MGQEVPGSKHAEPGHSSCLASLTCLVWLASRLGLLRYTLCINNVYKMCVSLSYWGCLELLK